MTIEVMGGEVRTIFPSFPCEVQTLYCSMDLVIFLLRELDLFHQDQAPGWGATTETLAVEWGSVIVVSRVSEVPRLTIN